MTQSRTYKNYEDRIIECFNIWSDSKAIYGYHKGTLPFSHVVVAPRQIQDCGICESMGWMQSVISPLSVRFWSRDCPRLCSAPSCILHPLVLIGSNAISKIFIFLLLLSQPMVNHGYLKLWFGLWFSKSSMNRHLFYVLVGNIPLLLLHWCFFCVILWTLGGGKDWMDQYSCSYSPYWNKTSDLLDVIAGPDAHPRSLFLIPIGPWQHPCLELRISHKINIPILFYSPRKHFTSESYLFWWDSLEWDN